MSGGYGARGMPKLLERPIVRPGAPSWLVAYANATDVGARVAFALAFVIATVGGILAESFLIVAHHPIVATISPVVVLALLIVMSRAALTNVLSATDPKIDGVRITGRGLELLADTLSRFDYARREFDKIPTGITWSEIDEHVRALLWDAAEHAGRMSALDVELHELRYAVAGTPQAAYRDEVTDRRAEHEQVMLAAQKEAEDLARKAGNAAAAAHLALVRTGDVARLEVVAPSAPVLVARDALAGAKERLDMLAAVWAELDPGGPVAVEKIRADREAQTRTRRTRRR